LGFSWHWLPSLSRDIGSDQNESEHCAQASRRDAIDSGADDCRFFEHGGTFLLLAIL
jgi:hypothetical protein